MKSSPLRRHTATRSTSRVSRLTASWLPMKLVTPAASSPLAVPAAPKICPSTEAVTGAWLRTMKRLSDTYWSAANTYM